MASIKRRPGVPANGSAVAMDRAGRNRPSRPARSRGQYNLAELEVVTWLVVAAIAIGIRLINLDGAPLQAAESARALNPWRILQHEAMGIGSSPLLTYLNVLLFLMLGASDAAARAVPCLIGSAVAISPVFLRSRLGKVGALIAALTLATSPSLVFASRTVDPTMLTVGLALGLVFATERYVRSRRRAYLYAGAVLFAFLLMSGPLAYDFSIIVIGFVVVYGLDVVRRELTSAQGQGDPLERRPWSDLGRLTVVFGLTLVVVGSGLATNLAGLGDSLAAPLAAWTTGLDGLSAHSTWLAPTLLLSYEPFSLVFGVAGAWLAFRRGRAFEIFLGWWACIGFVLLVLSNGDPTWVALIVVPLGLLAGSAVDGLPAGFVDREERRQLAIFAGVTLPLVATLLIAFGYVTLPDPIVPRELALAPPLALLAFVASYAFGYNWRSAFEATAVVAGVCLLAFNVHVATLLNPGGQLNPAEFFAGSATAGAATSVDVRRMATDVSTILDELTIARQIEGRDVDLTVGVARPFAEPLAWYLRYEPNVQIVDQVSDSPGVAIVAAKDKAPPGPYAGELYQFSVDSSRPGLTATDLWRWWMYHEAGSQTNTSVKVYVKTQLARP